MNKPASTLSAHVVRAKRDLLDVEWVAILLGDRVVCAAAFTLDAVI